MANIEASADHSRTTPKVGIVERLREPAVEGVPLPLCHLLDDAADCIEALIRRVGERLAMRCRMPGDDNQLLASELECMLAEMKCISDATPTRLNAEGADRGR